MDEQSGEAEKEEKEVIGEVVGHKPALYQNGQYLAISQKVGQLGD